MWQQFDDDDEEYFFALDIAIGNGITMNHRGVGSLHAILCNCPIRVPGCGNAGNRDDGEFTFTNGQHF